MLSEEASQDRQRFRAAVGQLLLDVQVRWHTTHNALARELRVDRHNLYTVKRGRSTLTAKQMLMLLGMARRRNDFDWLFQRLEALADPSRPVQAPSQLETVFAALSKRRRQRRGF
jgi:hypothetical protein